MSRNTAITGLVVIIVTIALAGAAYAVGASNAPDKGTATAETKLSYEQAQTSAEKRAYQQARNSGRKNGRKLGASQGHRRGTKAGRANGNREREQRAQEKAVEAEQTATERNLENLLKYGCDPELVFPDGTNGCTHDYGPSD